MSPTCWDKYLFTAKKFKGYQLYYYAYITDQYVYEIDYSKLITYQQYCDHLIKK